MLEAGVTTASAADRGALIGTIIWPGKTVAGTACAWAKLALPDPWSGMATGITAGASRAAGAGGRW